MKASYIIFGSCSLICIATELVEIILDIQFSYSDHLHNLLDHYAFLLINYIGFKHYGK